MSSGDATQQQPAAPVRLEDKKLSELTDLEIADLTQRAKAESSSLAWSSSSGAGGGGAGSGAGEVERALVGVKEPLQKLREEYQGSEVYRAKVDVLKRAYGYAALRRARGDGDCFYRSFAFLFVERLVDEPAESAQATLDQLEALLPLLDQAGFSRDIYEDFYEPLRDLVRKFASGNGSPSSKPTPEDILSEFNDAEKSNSTVVFLRLLTSAYLKANADEFAPFLFALEDDVRFIESGGAPTMEHFCSNHVEAVNKEADHLQMVALTRALAIHTRVVYLDQSGDAAAMLAASPTSGDGASSVNFVELEPEGSSQRLMGDLLYRPGHYDILYKSAQR